MQETLKKLNTIAERMGPRSTPGLDPATLAGLIPVFPQLKQAIDEALVVSDAVVSEFPFVTKVSEMALIDQVQEGYLNFYPMDQRNPYIPAAARGPWLVTLHGAVIHDSGGYGMLGFGHSPESLVKSLATPQVMANVMTAHMSQYRLNQRLRREIGQNRPKGCPYAKFICVNSGSEAMTVAFRISDAHARVVLDEDPKLPRKTMFLSFQGGFHGRTERPAMISSSSYKNYSTHLESFRNLQVNYTIPPNDIEALRKAYQWAHENNVYFEAMAIEPVMGEGNPGLALDPSFYKVARELTTQNKTLLIVDSIQAGLRTTGYLSLVDYPGFESLPAPDMESYSKALNGGQFPLSVLAIHENAVPFYKRGIYGNTKTTNPRACDVAVATLDLVTPQARSNIRSKGAELLQEFAKLAKEFPQVITKTQGQGLLCSMELNPEVFAVVGVGQLEEYLRKKGIGVIHGGKNALRFTPHFLITTPEIQLIISHLKEAFLNGPRLKK